MFGKREFAALLAAAALVPAAEPLFQTVDIDAGPARTVQVGGRAVKVRLLATGEERDKVRSAIRVARAEVEIDGARATLVCGNYQLPVRVGGVQADCAVTRAYYSNTDRDHWGLVNDARLRLWPGGSRWMPPGSFTYPVRQRWFATRTQMSNEPTYVNGGASISDRPVYYHAGLDIGGVEGLTEVIAATGGLVVAAGKQVLEGHEEVAGNPRFDETVWVLDERGWYHRYTHLYSFDPSVAVGQRIRAGQKVGLLGKEGTSGGWAHLHYEIVARQPSGKWGTLEGFAFLWEAYQREQRPAVIAFARPHVVALAGQPVRLDGSRSWSSTRIRRYDWTFSDGGTASGPSVERVYRQPGTYSETLNVTDSHGRADWDFLTVCVLDATRPEDVPPAIHAAYWPTGNLEPGRPVTFQVRTFGTTGGEEVWDFGDGTPRVQTRSDGNVQPLAKDGYAAVEHVFAKPGDYIVRVSRSNTAGLAGTAHLHVRIGR